MGALMKNRKLSIIFTSPQAKRQRGSEYSIFYAHKFPTQIIYKVKNTMLPVEDHEKKRDVGNPMLLP